MGFDSKPIPLSPPSRKRKHSDSEPIPLSPPSRKRKHSDSEPIPLSPPSRKRKHSDSKPIPLSPPSRKRKHSDSEPIPLSPPSRKRKHSDSEPIPLSPPSRKRKHSDSEPIPLSPPSRKRKHSDSEPIPLSPPSRKRKLATEMDSFTTLPTSPTKHSMCLRNSPKSSQPQTLLYITPDVFKTPKKVLLLARRSLKRVKLELNPPDPDNHTSLTDLFNYDGIMTMTSTPVPGSPPPIPSQYIHS